MDATVAIAALGFASTLIAAWLTAHWQTRGLVRTEILTSRVQAYGDCAEALYELERTSYNRAVTRIHKRAAGREPVDEQDAELAQKVYECNSAARAMIGRLAILSEATGLWQELDTVRTSVRDLHDLTTQEELTKRHDWAMDRLNTILAGVRDEFDELPLD